MMDNPNSISPAQFPETLGSGRHSLVENSGEDAVDFEGPGDPANPLNWSATYKWSIVVLISMMSLVV